MRYQQIAFELCRFDDNLFQIDRLHADRPNYYEVKDQNQMNYDLRNVCDQDVKGREQEANQLRLSIRYLREKQTNIRE